MAAAGVRVKGFLHRSAFQAASGKRACRVRAEGFDRNIPDPAEHHRALLDLAEQLGGRFRDEQQIAGQLALTIRYAGRSTSSRLRQRQNDQPSPVSQTRARRRTPVRLLVLDQPTQPYHPSGMAKARERLEDLTLDERHATTVPPNADSKRFPHHECCV
ncbi:hypothetical protein [Streptomyces sp. NPDC056883]|uniref:DinB/UmuC family translesion DNA polymerase n=1 Tax=Streptomyces sp. NPDC056883 TaxID=3345959 RepID=UPI00367AEBD7